MSPDSTLRRYRPGDEVKICALFEHTFSAKRSLDWWRWQWQRLPSGESEIFVAEKDGEIVGHVGAFTVDAFFDGNRVRVAIGGDVMVAPTLQSSTVGFSMGEAMRDQFDEHGWVSIGMGRKYPAAALRLFGVIQVGPVPRFVRPLTAKGIEVGLGRRLSLPLRLLGGAGARTLAAITRSIRPRLDIVKLDDPVELDRLAEESATFARWIRVRDSAYVRWRWLEQPERSWQLLVARLPSNRLLGYVVFGVDEQLDEETPVGRIVDVLAGDSRTTRALLTESCELLRRKGCGLVLFDCADPRPWARRACLLSGFIPYGEGPYFAWRPLPGSGIDGSKGFDDWYLTSGDCDFI